MVGRLCVGWFNVVSLVYCWSALVWLIGCLIGCLCVCVDGCLLFVFARICWDCLDILAFVKEVKRCLVKRELSLSDGFGVWELHEADPHAFASVWISLSLFFLERSQTNEEAAEFKTKAGRKTARMAKHLRSTYTR